MNFITDKNEKDKARRKYFLKQKLNRDREQKDLDDDYDRAFEADE